MSGHKKNRLPGRFSGNQVWERYGRYIEFLMIIWDILYKSVGTYRVRIFLAFFEEDPDIKKFVEGRVADPVHFRPDPDPANQNFKIGSGSYWHLKNQFKHQIFFNSTIPISSDIWMMIIFIWKNGKIHLKMCKTSIFKKNFLVYTTLHC